MHDAPEVAALTGALPIPAHDELPVDEVAASLRDHLARIRENGRALVLTDNGGAEAVLLNVADYERLLDALEVARAEAGIFRGLESMALGRGISAEESLRRVRERAAQHQRV